MVGDDYGHSDLGYHGGDIKTPNMDKWSALGVRLESFYTQPICAALSVLHEALAVNPKPNIL